MRKALILLALGCALVGCGGSSGGGVGALVPTMAQVRQGWTKTYHLVGFFTPNGGKQGLVSGTLTIKVTDRTNNLFTETHTFSITSAGVTNTYVDTYVYDQEADGSITQVSVTRESNPTLTVQTTDFAFPGAWTSTTTASGTTTYTDMTTASESLAVSGSTTVLTPVGTLDTWTTSYQSSYQGNTLYDLTEYYEPAIAGFAYASGTYVVSDGSFNGTFSLESTNIPLP
ncbi:MAG TPA: hypothetical protein VHE55_08535 [Fimbriimonadaceae bacterium]|nr:hypothetical protein [Fimbriimonadaceae bacterium]